MQIAYLESTGIPTFGVENMASICKGILGRSAQQVQAVVEWCQEKGVAPAALPALLEAHPQVLTYDVAADGSCLVKGAARASLVFQEAAGKRRVGVTFWRENAAFGTAPITPQK